MAEDDADSDDFYVFSAGATDEENTLKLINEDKLINTVIDSGASCNLMSEEELNFVTGVELKCWSALRTFMPMPQ